MLSWTPCRWRASWFSWDVILKNWGWICATWEPEQGINVSLMYILASFSICKNHKRCHFWALAHFLARLHPSAPVILFSLRVWGEMTGRGGRLESRHARNAEPSPTPPMYRSLPRSVREAYCSESKQLGCCGLLYHLTGTHSFALVFRSGKKALFFFFLFFVFLRQLQCFAGDTFHVAIRGPSPLDFGRRWMAATIPNSVYLSSSLGGFSRSQSVFFLFVCFLMDCQWARGKKAPHPSPYLLSKFE